MRFDRRKSIPWICYDGWDSLLAWIGFEDQLFWMKLIRGFRYSSLKNIKPTLMSVAFLTGKPVRSLAYFAQFAFGCEVSLLGVLGWTKRVESLVGAIGSVLAVDTDSVKVSLVDSASAATTDGDEGSGRCWSGAFLDWDSTESSPSRGMVFGKSYQRNNSHTSALPDIAAVRSAVRSRSRSVDSEL